MQDNIITCSPDSLPYYQVVAWRWIIWMRILFVGAARLNREGELAEELQKRAGVGFQSELIALQ
jgi:hypothetical protein